MNLADILDPKYGLRQDEWSLSKPKFGKENQLEVFGWSGKRGTNKLYTVKCHACSEDPELFGEGVFKISKGDLVKGSAPCGCARYVMWSEGQYGTKCTRCATDLGYNFIGLIEDFHGQNTRIKIHCDIHGDWDSGTINSLVGVGAGCPKCAGDATGVSNRINTKSDDIMIASFFASGQFIQGTEFWRSERLDTRGRVGYWYVSCPECESTGEGQSGNLQKGHRPCLCTQARQQEGYINWVVDSNNQAVAIKFGIANKATRRVMQQNNTCAYEVRNHSIYLFPDKLSCWTAERECRQVLNCGVLSQEIMPDGYTETTDVLNLVRIKQIYEKHGGVKSLNKET